MAYSDFKLIEIIDNFCLTLSAHSGLFADVTEQKCSDLLSNIFAA